MIKQVSSSKARLWIVSAILAMFAVAAAPYQGGAPPPSTPTPVQVWNGQLVSVVEDLSLRGSVLRVSVRGIKDLPVKVRSIDGSWSVVGLTGSKPEYGEFVVEFAALSRGNYVIEPQGLDTSFPFFADTVSYITVEFYKGPAPRPTATPSPYPTQPLPTPMFVPTLIPRPTETVPLAPLPPTPTSSPTAVVVPSTPLPIGVVYPEQSPTPRIVWSGRVIYTTRENIRGPGAIAVRVPGQIGLIVELEIEGFHVQAKTGSKPEYGGAACEFGGLGPGRYTVSPQGLGSTVSVDLQQGEFAMVEFVPVAVPEIPGTAAPDGIAAWVLSTPAVQPTVTSLLLTPSPLMTVTRSSEIGAAVPSVSIFGPPIPAIRTSLEPIWKSRVVQHTAGTGFGPATLVVRVSGARNLPVILKAGGWQASAKTGTKLEYGEFACEFGGLTPGEYEIIPDGLELSHKMEINSGEFVLVDFFYEMPQLPVIPALAIPVAGSDDGDRVWSGRVVSQTIEAGDATDWGGVTVQVLDTETLAVEVRSADGWSAFALTEIRPELKGSAAEFVRLSPGTYQAVPQGLGAWVQLNVAKGSHTWIEFASRQQ